jgi:coenzyme F420-reducing hydrogenase beta subunit
MQMDEDGFRYPLVDLEGCCNCGNCYHICPMVKDDGFVLQHPGSGVLDTFLESTYPMVLAAWNNDNHIRHDSSSGGVFTLLAQQVINSEGIVVGAGFDDNLQLRHRAVDTTDDLKILRGSKYIQSDMGDVLRRIDSYLKIGRKVLFSGTPCQVAGLKSIAGRSHDALITCDLVCHGVPSQKLFHSYIKELEVSQGARATGISFRDKKNGWKRYTVKIKFANGTVHEKPLDNDNFIRLFLSDLCLRPSCYYCPFSTLPRQGDITLADYWGVAAAHPGIDDDRGVSLVLVNSEKGAEAFQQITDAMTVYPSDLIRAISGNPCIIRPVIINPDRQRFMYDLDYYTTSELCKKYVKPPSQGRRSYFFTRRIMYRLKNLLYFLKGCIK